MSKQFKLSEGSLQDIMHGAEVKDPVMQILGSKRVTSHQGDKERYRLLLSDGKHFISYAMLSVQVHDAVGGSTQIPDNSVIKLKRYITSVINNSGNKGSEKRVLVILDLEKLTAGENLEKIGSPVVLPEGESATTNGTTNKDTKPSTSFKPTTVAKPPTTNGLDQSVSLQDHLTHPIDSLSPFQNKWVIKARVSSKSQIRTWSNAKGEGKLFSVDLIDESGEIRATVFRDLVDKYYDLLEVDKVYYISKCQLKQANKRYSTLKHDYEMTFTNDTVVQECHDDVTSIPVTQYSFVGIDKIAHIEKDTAIDVIGVCKSASDLVEFTSKNTGRELKKREVMLVDQSNTAVSLTLWGSDGEKFDGSTNPVVCIKGAKVSEYNGGKSISLFSGSVMKINPDIQECHELRGWFDNVGHQTDVTNISASTGAGMLTPWMSFKELKETGVINKDRGDYFQQMGTVLLIRSENAIYKACPTENCKKKMIDMENGMYRCEKCNREFPNFIYRLLCQVNVGDWSGNNWVSLFSSEAETILGVTAHELGEALEANPNAVADICDKKHFKQYIFRCRAKTEIFSDQQRLKVVAVKVEPVNYKEYNAHLLSRIQELTN